MKRFDLLAAAVLAVGGFGLAVSPAFAEDQAAQPSQQQQQAGQQPSAAQPSAGQPATPADQSGAAPSAQSAADRGAAAQQASESDVRQALSQCAQAVLTKGGANNLIQCFAQR